MAYRSTSHVGRRRAGSGARPGRRRADSRGDTPDVPQDDARPRDPSGPGPGRHRAGTRRAGGGRPVERWGAGPSWRPRKPHVIIAAAVCGIAVAGTAIGSVYLGDDAADGPAEALEPAAFMYSSGRAVPDDFQDQHPVVIDLVYSELEERFGVDPERLYDSERNPGGYRVVLTVDEDIQQAVHTAAREHSAGDAAAVAVEPESGAILGYWGGDETDLAGIDALHPPSATFDMMIAATALKQGASLESRWGGEDEDESSTLMEAVRGSQREPLLAVVEHFGADAVFKTAADLGVSAVGTDGDVVRLDQEATGGFEPEDIGAFGVSVADMAGVYAAIANNGLRVDPHLIERVVDGNGENVQARESVQSLQVISREAARDLQHLALGIGEPLDGHEHFGLAGSRTGEDYPLHSWYIGAIPQLSVAAWSGGDAAAGGEALWRSIMTAVIAVEGYVHAPWDGPARTGSDDLVDLGDEETTLDPDSEHCQASPDDPACEEAEEDECADGGCEPEPQPTSEPPRDPTTQPPPQEPTTRPTQEPSQEPSEDPSDDGGSCWFIC